MKTVVIGATTNPARYAWLAVELLHKKGITVVPIGIRQGKTAANYDIIHGLPEIEAVHTVTLYIGSDIQPEYYEYILQTLRPKRIIFNPGTENPDFYAKIKAAGYPIEIEVACTLVMLQVGSYFESV